MLYNWNDMRFLKALLIGNWQSILKYAALFGVLAAALWWQLGTLLPGFSKAEQSTYAAAGFSQLFDNPLHAPYLLLVKLLTILHPDSLLVTRLVAIAGGLAVLAALCWLLYRWYGSRVAIAGTALFGASAWFLHVARMGTPDILLFGTLGLLAVGFWLKESRSTAALIVCFILAALLLYVPGMVWFILAVALWQWKTINQIFKDNLSAVSVGGVVLLILLAPLAWGLVRDHTLIQQWLGLPSTMPAIGDVVSNVLHVPYNLAISNTADASRWLGTTPILDAFSVAMFLLGSVLLLKTIQLRRAPILLSFFVIGILLAGLNGSAAYSYIIPIVYIIIAAGVGYTLDQWLNVFPRNPIARGVGYGCIAIAVAITCAFHIQHYFIGWPHARATLSEYTIHKP